MSGRNDSKKKKAKRSITIGNDISQKKPKYNNQTNRTGPISAVDTHYTTASIRHHQPQSRLSTSDLERAIQDLCFKHDFTRSQIETAAHISRLQPYATPEQWVFMVILTQRQTNSPSDLNSGLFREAFESYPGSSLQIQLHTLMDEGSSNCNLQSLRSLPRDQIDAYIRMNQTEFSHKVWAIIIAFVLFHDTYQFAVDDDSTDLLLLVRHFWKRLYQNVHVTNEVDILASRGWTAGDVFHDDIQACWVRGLNFHIDFKDPFVYQSLTRTFVKPQQQRSGYYPSNPKVLDAFLRFLLTNTFDKGVDISYLQEPRHARRFGIRVSKRLSAMLVSRQFPTSQANSVDPPADNASDGPWRTFSSDFHDEHGNILAADTDRICYAFQWLTKQLEPYLPHLWQQQATEFLLMKLSTIEQEVLVMWSRNSTLFRPGFAPSVPSNSTLDVFADIGQPMAYDMLDAIFEHQDIPRISQREGMWVYRGLSQLHGDSSSVHMASSQFISTTYDRVVAESFLRRGDSEPEHGLLMKIWLPPGTPFLLLDAFNNTEHEILLPRNHELRPFVVANDREDNTAHFRFVHKQVSASSINEVTTMLERNFSLRSNQRKIVQEQHHILQQQMRKLTSLQDDTTPVILTSRVIQYLRYGRRLFSMTFDEQLRDMSQFLAHEYMNHTLLSYVTSAILALDNDTLFISLEATATMSSMDFYIKTNDTNFWSLFMFDPRHLPGLCFNIVSRFNSEQRKKFAQTTLISVLKQCVRWWNQCPNHVIDKSSVPRTHDEWRRVFQQAHTISAFTSSRFHGLLSQGKFFDETAVLRSLTSVV